MTRGITVTVRATCSNLKCWVLSRPGVFESERLDSRPEFVQDLSDKRQPCIRIPKPPQTAITVGAAPGRVLFQSALQPSPPTSQCRRSSWPWRSLFRKPSTDRSFMMRTPDTVEGSAEGPSGWARMWSGPHRAAAMARMAGSVSCGPRRAVKADKIVKLYLGNPRAASRHATPPNTTPFDLYPGSVRD